MLRRRSYAFSASFDDAENSIPAENEVVDDSEEESVKKTNRNAAVCEADPIVDERTTHNEAVEPTDMADSFQENEMLSNVGEYLVPIKRPPSHREVKQDVEMSTAAAENRRPTYSYTSHLDRLAWKQTPSFTDSRSHWDKIRLQHSAMPSSFMDSQYQVKLCCRKRAWRSTTLI